MSATMILRRWARALPALLLAAAPATAAAPAELILTNARVYTVEPGRPWAEAVAIGGGRILAVGSAAAVTAHRGPATRVVDVHGRLLMPAFGDAHNHPILGGLSFTQCSLYDGKTIADYRRIIAGCVADTPGTGTIYGVGWQEALFPPNGIPDKAILDAIGGDRPMIFESMDLHALWVNSKALALAGITRSTPNPPGGVIDRDPRTGEAIGGLEEQATTLVAKLIPPPTDRDYQDALTYAVHLFNGLGITSWHDADIRMEPGGGSRMLDAYHAVQDRGALTMHVAMDLRWDGNRGLEQIPAILAASASARAMGLTAHGVKYFIDGVIPQQTAAMLEPYEGTTIKGDPQIAPAMLAQAVTALDAKGFQAHFHAIGDAAVREALDAVAAARQAHGMTDMRPMISHMNIVEPADQTRFGPLGVTAVFQPLWAQNEPYMILAIKQVGPRRARYIYPERSIHAAGGRLAYGADWSVASPNPFEGIQVTLTRQAPDHPEWPPLLPDEAVTLPQAIAAYTINVAYVNHLEAETGSIAPGKSADLIILDQDLFKIPPHAIAATKVLLTLYRGHAVAGSLDALR